MILINPYYNRTQKLGIFARYVPLSVPIGIGALAGYLLHREKPVKILDEHITPITYEVLDDYVRFNNATPYPGTKLYQMAKEENRLNIDKNYANLNACGTLVEGPFVSSKLAYVPKTSTKRELRNDILKANLFFSLRPQGVFRLLVHRAGPAGWFLLPKKWYLSPREWYYLIQFGLLVLLSLVKIYLPRISLSRERIEN